MLFEPVPFGRYQLVERIAVGGMAEIFKAKSYGAHGFEKTLAVKRILPQLAADPEFVDMFINEARLMMRLAHPKVVQVLDFGQVQGQYFIAMEYIEGIDALALLRTCARHRCRPTTGIAVHIAADVLDALDYAHNLRDERGGPLGIVHRDISPSNIFISELGEVKLGDFGIARAHSRRLHSESGGLKGKYGYMSPEIVNGAAVDHRSDLFSVAVVLAELLMVRRLFMAKSELEVLLQVRDARLDRLDRYGQHVPPELRRILEAGLARDPGLRYQEAAAFRDALHHFLFDQRRMIRPIEVRSFLRRLDELEREGVTPTPAAGPARGAVWRSAERTLDGDLSPAAVTQLEKPARPAAEKPVERQAGGGTGTQPGIGEAPPAPHATSQGAGPTAAARASSLPADDTPSIGRRRRLRLEPPPRPAPLQRLREHEVKRLETDETLAALSELELEEPSARDFKSSESRSSLRPAPIFRTSTPSEPGQVAASQVATSSGSFAAPELEGELLERSLANLLFQLATAEETGLLVLQNADLTKEIYLVDGDPQYITSNLADELFGQYLVSKRVISEGELSMALAMLPHFEGKLGSALVALKLMRPVQVIRHLTHQVRRKLLKAFAWQSGSYAYYRGQTCQLEAAPLGLDAFEIIGAGVNELPEEVLTERLRPLLDRLPRSKSPPPLPPEVFRLGTPPRRVFDVLDGRHSLGDLLGRFDDAEQRNSFGRMVYLLLETGLAGLVHS